MFTLTCRCGLKFLTLPLRLLLLGSFTQAGNFQSLPLYNPRSVNPRLKSSSARYRLSIQGYNQAQPGPPNKYVQPGSSVSQSGSGTPNPGFQVYGRFIYWCIDESDTHTHLVELDALNLTDHSLATTLLHEYVTIMGWWHRFWAMSSCRGACFKKVRQLSLPISLLTAQITPFK